MASGRLPGRDHRRGAAADRCQDRQTARRRHHWTGPERLSAVGPSSALDLGVPGRHRAKRCCPRSLGIRGATLGRQRSGFGQARRAARRPPRSGVHRRCTPQDRPTLRASADQAGSAEFGRTSRRATWPPSGVAAASSGRSSSATSRKPLTPAWPISCGYVFRGAVGIGDRQLAACGVGGGPTVIPTPPRRPVVLQALHRAAPLHSQVARLLRPAYGRIDEPDQVPHTMSPGHRSTGVAG